jgi:5'-deoxynucleotidase YfbR-like HD superfamily hydrolase
MSNPRIGDWCQTFTGRQFWPMDPRPEDVAIEDIAHHLSLLCRFGGACRCFYSVAQHSVLVSHACDPADALWGLLHDASEAYLVDVPRPIKKHLTGYREIEASVQRVICERFGLPLEEPRSVALADSVLLFTEARDLMSQPPSSWKQMAEPLKETIYPYPSNYAKYEFIHRFSELQGQRDFHDQPSRTEGSRDQDRTKESRSEG